MARTSNFIPVGGVGYARIVTGVIAADSGTLTDANIPTSGAINCQAYDTIFVGAEITAGTSPTITVEPLFRDEEAADGSRWKRILVGSPDGVTLGAAAVQTTGAMTGAATGAGLNMVELKVFGHKAVFLRITAVANATSTTDCTILVKGGRTRDLSSIGRT